MAAGRPTMAGEQCSKCQERPRSRRSAFRSPRQHQDEARVEDEADKSERQSGRKHPGRQDEVASPEHRPTALQEQRTAAGPDAPARTPKGRKARSVENGQATVRDTRFQPGNPGRRKGTPNKATKEIRDLARALTTGSPAYMARLKQRLLAGKCHPSVEVALLHYAHGRPPDKIE